MSWEPTKEYDPVTGEKTVDPTPETAITQAIGTASMCWKTPPHGVFDSDQAMEIVNGLTAYLREHPLHAFTENGRDRA